MKYPIKSSSTLPSLGDDLMDFTFDPHDACALHRHPNHKLVSSSSTSMPNTYASKL